MEYGLVFKVSRVDVVSFRQVPVAPTSCLSWYELTMLSA